MKTSAAFSEHSRGRCRLRSCWSLGLRSRPREPRSAGEMSSAAASEKIVSGRACCSWRAALYDEHILNPAYGRTAQRNGIASMFCARCWVDVCVIPNTIIRSTSVCLVATSSARYPSEAFISLSCSRARSFFPLSLPFEEDEEEGTV